MVIFDPFTVSGRSTYQHPTEPSVGVEYLLVGGVPVVDKGKLMKVVLPGKALHGVRKRSESPETRYAN